MISDISFTVLGLSVFIPTYAVQLMLAAAIGLGIGFERALKRKAASLTTFSFIGFGSCLFTILSVEGAQLLTESHFDATRIAAQIVTGIGFVGGGVIYKAQDSVHGITTAALVWMTAALGMACGFNRPEMAMWGFAVYLIILACSRAMHQWLWLLRARKISKIRGSRPSSDGGYAA